MHEPVSLRIHTLRKLYSVAALAKQMGVKLVRSGTEWTGLCPFHDDHTPSFTIFRGNGDVERFHCFGCGKHGDVVDFVREIKGFSTVEAMQFLEGEPALINIAPSPVEVRDPYAGIVPVKPPRNIEVGEVIRLYNPKRAGTDQEWGQFAPEAVYPYKRADGSLIGYVLRRSRKTGGKETPMVMWVRLPDGKECWSRYPFPKPRPLYNAPLIETSLRIIVVEGEKCADALRSASGACVVTWPGGTNGVAYADWSILEGRDVVIWPDADQPGLHAANGIGRLLAQRASRVRIMEVADKPKGWDAANAIAEGMSKDDIDGFINLRARAWSQEALNASVNATGGRLSVAPRPLIEYHPSQLPAIVDQACAAILERGVPVYARGTMLVRPVTLHPASAVGTAHGPTQLVPVDRPYLVERLTDLIDWRTPPTAKRPEPKAIGCPHAVAETIIARRGEWPFPQIRTIVTAPTLRPDGTVFDTPGFDKSTGILFSTKHAWPRVADSPARQDAEKAMSQLQKLISSFPFAGNVDRSAALAMIMTAVVRSCLPTAPLFGVSAPTPGTGKSKLVDIASIIATGQAASVMSAPRDEDEMRKQIGAALIGSETFITLDNIETPLRSEFLCQVLTQEQVSVRVLGESRNVKLPTASMFCATGNSLRVAGDLTRRVVLINLDARMERPEERVFETDVLALARQQRIPLVIAVLTILRAFLVQGGPKLTPALGSFEHWSNLVRSSLVWLGEEDPLANVGQMRENDPERERTIAILEALPRNEIWTTADIARRFRSERDCMGDFQQYEGRFGALAEFADRSGQLNVTAFGNFLRKHQGRILSGLRIVRKGQDRRKVAQWTIEELNSPPN